MVRNKVGSGNPYPLSYLLASRIRSEPFLDILWEGGEDTIMWKYSRDGEFSTKSAYVLANTPPET